MTGAAPSAGTALDRPAVLLAVALASAVGVLFTNALPVILGAFSSLRGYDETALASLGGSMLAGVCLATVTGTALVDRLPWRRLIVPALGLMPLLAAGLPLTHTVWMSSAAMLAIGLCSGAILAPCLAMLGQAENAPRAFGAATLAQVLLTGLAALVLPAVLFDRFGLWSVSLVTGALAAAAALASAALPERRRAPKVETVREPRRAVSLSAVSILAGFGVLSAGFTGVWQFLDRIGAWSGSSATLVGGTVAASLILGAAGALAPALFGRRFGLVWPVALAVTLQLLSAAFLATAGVAGFVIGAILLNIGWNMCVPFMYAVLAGHDRTGRLLVATPAIQTFGGVVGAVASGVLVVGAGLPALIAVFAACSLVTLALHTCGVRRPRAEALTV